jgi:hypothetical protein
MFKKIVRIFLFLKKNTSQRVINLSQVLYFEKAKFAIGLLTWKDNSLQIQRSGREPQNPTKVLL